jgi:hypothetical protein
MEGQRSGRRIFAILESGSIVKVIFPAHKDIAFVVKKLNHIMAIRKTCGYRKSDSTYKHSAGMGRKNG